MIAETPQTADDNQTPVQYYNTIQLTDIVISASRQRQEFDPAAIVELRVDIRDNGLMHPPVLRHENGQWILVAGERRLRAITQMFELGESFICNEVLFTADAGTLPFTSLGELTPLQAEEAELSENLKRRDLTWQEHADAVARLHAMRKKQMTQEVRRVESELHQTGKTTGTVGEGDTWSIADTAEELTGRRDGSYQDKTRKEIIVGNNLSNPAIAKAASVDEAYKLLLKDEERKKNVALAVEVGKVFDAGLHQIHNSNCLEWMQAYIECDGREFDVILTDPPYGMGAHEFGDAAGKLQSIDHRYDDSYEAWKTLMSEWSRLSYQIAAAQAHAYVFCDIDNFHELKGFMETAGWYVFRTPLIAYKTDSGRVPLPDRGPRRQYELILYAIKGKKPVTHIYPDVIPSKADANTLHGAQKPVALFQNLLQRSVKAGDYVLDTFAGSGTVFPAASQMQCYAVGCELNPEYYGMCLNRIKQLKQSETPNPLEN